MATLPKKLFAQVTDFARLKGTKMSPEQTEAALKRLKQSSFSPSGWEKRDQFVDQLKSTKLLEDPNIERVYAVGSSVTPKPDPSDLDILYRGKTAEDTHMARSDMLNRSILEDISLKNIHSTTPPTVDFVGSDIRQKTPRGFNKASKKIAEDTASVGVARYGPDHQWIRLVGIPAAISFGLLSAEEVEAAFKPAEVAKATAKLLKLNAQKIEVPEEAKRITGVTESMLKIPQSEYSRIAGVHVQPEIIQSGESLKGGYIPPGGSIRPTFNNKVFLSAMKVDPTTFPHEMVHSRQHQRPGVKRLLDELQKHVEKWLKDPWEQYFNDPKELHARGVGTAVQKRPEILTKTLYDEIYDNELYKALQYTEEWLQHLDPTFKARFIKNIAIGGAVMTALQLGPEGEPSTAEAMPRGVYQAIDYGAQLWRKTRDVTKLIGRTISPGKVIDDIVVTGENERRIRFTDGTESIVDKSDIAKLYRSFGTKDYEAITAIDKDPVSQMTRALKSLSFHEARYKRVPENQALQYVDDYLRNLSEMGEHISPDLVFVQRGDKLFTMPRIYAELLEEQDLLKILRGDKYIELLEKYKVK